MGFRVRWTWVQTLALHYLCHHGDKCTSKSLNRFKPKILNVKWEKQWYPCLLGLAWGLNRKRHVTDILSTLNDTGLCSKCHHHQYHHFSFYLHFHHHMKDSSWSKIPGCNLVTRQGNFSLFAFGSNHWHSAGEELLSCFAYTWVPFSSLSDRLKLQPGQAKSDAQTPSNYLSARRDHTMAFCPGLHVGTCLCPDAFQGLPGPHIATVSLNGGAQERGAHLLGRGVI